MQTNKSKYKLLNFKSALFRFKIDNFVRRRDYIKTYLVHEAVDTLMKYPVKLLYVSEVDHVFALEYIFG